MDLDLIKEVSQALKIPIIASSGANNLKEIKFILDETNINAIAIGSSLHSW